MINNEKSVGANGCWPDNTENIRHEIKLDKYVIMSNHLHYIIIINRAASQPPLRITSNIINRKQTLSSFGKLAAFTGLKGLSASGGEDVTGLMREVLLGVFEVPNWHLKQKNKIINRKRFSGQSRKIAVRIGSGMRKFLERFKSEIRFYQAVLKNSGTPKLTKFFLGLAVAYALSPIDIIPDFIPVVGYLDDLLIVPILVFIAMKLIPRKLLQEIRGEMETS